MKQLLSLICIFLACSQIWAQESRFIIGLDLTGSTTNHWGDFNRESVDPIQGIYPGFNFEYFIQNHLSLKSGLAYEKKGISYDAVASNISGTEVWNINHFIYYEYISIPLLLSYSTQGVINFYANGGFFGGFLVKQISEYYSERDNTTNIEELEDSSKKYDAGISIGAGINKSFGKRFCIDLGIRDNLGLVNIFLAESSGSLKTNSLGLVLALKLKI
ncbi:MAG: porin family protein [Bacteroidota bacterium]